MNFTISKTLQSKLDKVGDIQLHQLDRTNGVKCGTKYTVQPSFKFMMIDKETLQSDGTYKYDTSDAKPFDMANILLLNRYKNKDGDWVDNNVSAFAINIKLDEQPNDNITYCTMIFRGTSFDRIVDEVIAMQQGLQLDRAKALSAIIKANGLTISTFIEHLNEGKSIEFAQYKRGSNLNFVDARYYEDKIMREEVTEQEIS